MTTLYPLQLKEDPDEETREEEERGEGGKGDESDSDDSYDDVEIAPLRYTNKTLMESEDLPDGYVHLLKSKRKDGKEEVIVTRRQNEYGKKINTYCPCNICTML